MVTIEPQYANQIDSLPSQSFRQFNLHSRLKQDQIHGRTVVDGWAGAIMQKPPAIQKYPLRTDQPTRQGIEVEDKYMVLHLSMRSYNRQEY